ncbi:hypothetical protein M378DRAFT_6056 [Amanita muscaria Koide BX008]|uniref:Uncharacterized protein n=1 Tax=Amanita muscaria (strain Koide BX008) TaxID=946122 RepID=A0A0C2TV82_AMAMK|nr:hypothetical protein M378DRAFT_6056 [Amanita muscaria Koide BX008]
MIAAAASNPRFRRVRLFKISLAGQKFDVVPRQQEIVRKGSWKEWDEKAVLDIVEVVKEFVILRAPQPTGMAKT